MSSWILAMRSLLWFRKSLTIALAWTNKNWQKSGNSTKKLISSMQKNCSIFNFIKRSLRNCSKNSKKKNNFLILIAKIKLKSWQKSAKRPNRNWRIMQRATRHCWLKRVRRERFTSPRCWRKWRINLNLPRKRASSYANATTNFITRTVTTNKKWSISSNWALNLTLTLKTPLERVKFSTLSNSACQSCLNRRTNKSWVNRSSWNNYFLKTSITMLISNTSNTRRVSW